MTDNVDFSCVERGILVRLMNLQVKNNHQNDIIIFILHSSSIIHVYIHIFSLENQQTNKIANK